MQLDPLLMIEDLKIRQVKIETRDGQVSGFLTQVKSNSLFEKSKSSQVKSYIAEKIFKSNQVKSPPFKIFFKSSHELLDLRLDLT